MEWKNIDNWIKLEVILKILKDKKIKVGKSSKWLYRNKNHKDVVIKKWSLETGRISCCFTLLKGFYHATGGSKLFH